MLYRNMRTPTSCANAIADSNVASSSSCSSPAIALSSLASASAARKLLPPKLDFEDFGVCEEDSGTTPASTSVPSDAGAGREGTREGLRLAVTASPRSLSVPNLRRHLSSRFLSGRRDRSLGGPRGGSRSPRDRRPERAAAFGVSSRLASAILSTRSDAEATRRELRRTRHARTERAPRPGDAVDRSLGGEPDPAGAPPRRGVRPRSRRFCSAPSRTRGRDAREHVPQHALPPALSPLPSERTLRAPVPVPRRRPGKRPRAVLAAFAAPPRASRLCPFFWRRARGRGWREPPRTRSRIPSSRARPRCRSRPRFRNRSSRGPSPGARTPGGPGRALVHGGDGRQRRRRARGERAEPLAIERTRRFVSEPPPRRLPPRRPDPLRVHGRARVRGRRERRHGERRVGVEERDGLRLGEPPDSIDVRRGRSTRRASPRTSRRTERTEEAPARSWRRARRGSAKEAPDPPESTMTDANADRETRDASRFAAARKRRTTSPASSGRGRPRTNRSPPSR